MATSDYLSNNIAIEILDEQIAHLKADIGELEEVINKCTSVANSLIKDYSKKKKYLDILEKKKREIVGMKVSFGSESKDKAYEDVVDRREDKEYELRYANVNSKNPFVRAQGAQLQYAVQRLKEKEGKISQSQRTIVNKKLATQLRKARRLAKNKILDEYVDNLLDKYEAIRKAYMKKAGDSSADGKEVRSFIYNGGACVSVAKFKMLELYCEALKLKNRVVNGAIALPSEISELIKKKITKRSSR